MLTDHNKYQMINVTPAQTDKRTDLVYMAIHHRLGDRCVLRRISDMNFHSWAILGNRGCRKKIQTAIRRVTNNFNLKKSTLVSALKRFIMWSYRKWHFFIKEIIENRLPLEFQKCKQIELLIKTLSATTVLFIEIMIFKFLYSRNKVINHWTQREKARTEGYLH